MEEKKRGSFTGSIGFVLAAAGSAVGLGNIWRFPYLAARDGGGLFLVVYLVLALTFGFTLLTAEVAIGRKTKQSPLTAYKKLSSKFGWMGVVACLVPFLIMPYYCVIGGWVLKYFIVFLTGHGLEAAEDGYFTGFITSQTEPIVMFVVFLVICAVIIFMGVDKGIEKSAKIIMPVLLLLSFFMVVMDAVGQLFYSLSVAMGIMIAYGSYVPDDANLVKSINQIEIFDTMVAFLAGVMVIPSVVVFMGQDGMTAGPSLMFVSLPKVFAAMGSRSSVLRDGTLCGSYKCHVSS